MSTVNLFYPLVTPEEVKALIVEINNNIDNDYIKYNIELAQKKWLRPLLGFGLYNQILLEVSGGTISGNTADYIIYNDYLKMILALTTHQRLVSSMSYQLENNGLRIKISEVSNSTEMATQNYIKNNIQNDIDFFKAELVEYICNNRSDYPLYFNDPDKRSDHYDKRKLTNTWKMGSINSRTDRRDYDTGLYH